MDITELIEYFESATLPKELKTSEGYIFDLQKYVSTHINTIKSHKPLKAYEAYYWNLVRIKEILEKGA